MADNRVPARRNNEKDRAWSNFLQAISRDENEAAGSDLKKRMTLSLIFLACQTGIAAAVKTGAIDVSGGYGVLVIQVILLILLILTNHRCFTDAFLSIRHRRPEKNLLAAVGTIFAIAVGQLVTAGVVLTTMAVCRYCEAYINLKLISHLTDLTETEPSDSGINEGDIIRIPAGKIIPSDGVIVSGGTTVDERMITGERIPPKKRDGDIVFAGTKNLTSDISIRVTRTGGDRIISRIILHISHAITTRTPMSAKYEKIARWFVVIVCLIAVIVQAGWMVLGGGVEAAAYTGIAVLIIANPYAFSVGVPMTVFAAVVRGAQHGILIRTAEILEDTRDINTVVINKRGTVTSGDPEVSDIIPLEDGFDISLAGILEGQAQHPFGKMIRKEAEVLNGDLPSAEEVEYKEGRGIKCRYKGNSYIVGNEAFMIENGIDTQNGTIDDLFRQGKSIVFFADETRVIGAVALRDAPKPASLKAITQMENLGLDVVMVTGDSRRTAEAIRSEIGIDHIYADILPENKKKIVEGIRRDREKIVAMVGDGERDAEAIEASDLGISIGSGREISIGSADIVLVMDDLLDVVRAMKLSRRSVRGLRQSVAFAYAYNIAAIICASGLFALFTGITMMPVAAAICMCISQILVILNPLRIKRMRL